MAETTVAFLEPEPESGPEDETGSGGEAEDESKAKAASEPERADSRDRHPDTDGWLGDFRRDPAVFALFRTGPNNGGHPLLQPEYRIECNDGAGPRVICRFTDEPEAVYEWFGAWRNDEWCDWILEQARRLIAHPENT